MFVVYLQKKKLIFFFQNKYFNFFDVLENAKQYSSHNSYSFSNDAFKINLNTYIQEGSIESKQLVYQLTLDSDAYIDDAIKAKDFIHSKEKLDTMNDCLFDLYLRSLKPEMIKKLQNDDTDFGSEGFIGIELND